MGQGMWALGRYRSDNWTKKGMGFDSRVAEVTRETLPADALHRAGLSSVDDLGGVEVHDCFAASAYLAIDHVRITVAEAPPA